MSRILWIVPWLCSVRGDIHVGAAFNILSSFGDLGSEVKLRDENNPWFPEYLSRDVFVHVEETRRPFLSPDPDFNGDFLLQLCDDITQLKAALYLDHEVEGVEKAWRAYTGGWSRSITAARLGVNYTYLLGAHGYALVRLTRHYEQVVLNPNQDLYLNQWAADGAKKITLDESQSVFEFIGSFGSHYLSSYISGDSLYQVFVFAPEVYEELRNAMKQYEDSGLGLDQVLSYFTPWRTEHIGRIISLSGNASVELWADRNLRSTMFLFAYSSLLKLHSAPELLQMLNSMMGDNMLLAVQLRSLAPFLTDSRKQLWFTEVMDNHLKLWETSV